MPVYNEVSTFATTMDAVLAKEMPGIDKEIIVVESNSTDGTRELVSKYQNYPGVKVLLEDRPRGKGSAVRAAFRLVKGDYILIQDADAEYDVNDYDALIEPLQKYQRAFVLGSRHVGDWKVRQLNDQPGMAAFLNVGHFLFGTLFNVLYKQDLKDPFTMYKVFRKDCLTDLGFECNRFDFDFELVIKLLRKGYRPLEIPVNYKARSFKEGKKISVFRDSWNLLVTIIKYRFAPIYVEPVQARD
jgi:glycosyltransferase involved in cell wall biosynthesis